MNSHRPDDSGYRIRLTGQSPNFSSVSTWMALLPESDLIWEYTQPDPRHVATAAKAFDVPEIYARILAARGIVSREDGIPFFNPDRSRLHDPYLMKGMEAAVERIMSQVAGGEPILIFGDYDVDGTTAASMLWLSFKAMGAQVSTYIPSRESEGYGLSRGGVDYAVLIGAGLLITCDCGINAIDVVAYALSKGVEVIITDHHVPGDELPAAVAILNPKQSDCPYPFKGLCGGGVAFKLALAVAGKGGHDEDLVWQHADLIALGIAADIVPILDENRIIVHEGLKLMRQNSRPGLAALWQVAGHAGKPVTIGRIVFGVAPKINAAGRLGDAGRAVKLLTTDNHYHAVSIARDLMAENERRKRIQEQTVEEAIYQVHARHDPANELALVLWQEGWHQGVIGIVAARIRDLFNRPTAIIAVKDGVGRGSLRSMAGFDLYKALTACADLLLGYGGHTVAAGLSISADQLEQFSQRFIGVANEALTIERLRPRQLLDGDMDLSIIDRRFIRLLDSLEPYGPGNRRPVMASKGVRAAGSPRLVGDRSAHLKCAFSQNGVTLDAIGFDMADHYEKLLLDRPLDIAYVVEENQWQGQTRVQLQLKDIKIGAPA